MPSNTKLVTYKLVCLDNINPPKVKVFKERIEKTISYSNLSGEVEILEYFYRFADLPVLEIRCTKKVLEKIKKFHLCKVEIIVRYEWDYYHGSIEGLFACTREDLDSLVGKDFHFGEVLGKHSDVSIFGTELSDFEILSEDQDLIDRLVESAGDDCICGYYPFNYAAEPEEQE